jgi:hypothetical protein
MPDDGPPDLTVSMGFAVERGGLRTSAASSWSWELTEMARWRRHEANPWPCGGGGMVYV